MVDFILPAQILFETAKEVEMSTTVSKLEVSNGGSNTVTIYVEPWPSTHTLSPGQGLEVHVERSASAFGAAFHVVIWDNDLVIHPAGSMDHFVDSFAVRDGVKLETEDKLETVDKQQKKKKKGLYNTLATALGFR
ncbi:hypothetical protein [Cypionkella sp.]|uniref:hypothetical protein n=1 Tax=Cypionkella sp. TaxID=2811411 RepID=UPI002AB8A08F|nr:hypothetical protein [Cypionkella sp.]MDZ4391674.1 hypothetical protein [Cypionkella sp.]